jgi:hypothetical protein
MQWFQPRLNLVYRLQLDRFRSMNRRLNRRPLYQLRHR